MNPTFLGPSLSAHFPRRAVVTPRPTAAVEKMGTTEPKVQSPAGRAVFHSESELCHVTEEDQGR